MTTAPPRMEPLLTWYGDDFTGSTDALEVLARGGLRAVLLLEQAGDAFLRRFADAQAIGLAGISRSQSPLWMTQHLPDLFAWLRALGGRLCHYKVCSTFDSSPEVGNIGRALEIGRAAFGAALVPLIAGAPALCRYTAFGHLFASFGDDVYRIDRHPAMSRHPVTPMREADLRQHLALQTNLNIELVSLPEMQAGQAVQRLHDLRESGCEAALLDVLDESSLLEAGRAIWESEPPCPFVVGSSGVEHSLVAWWGKQGALPPAPAQQPPDPVDRLVVLSGSLSPATSRQIHQAIRAGYEAIQIDPAVLCESETEADRLTATAEAALAQGRSIVLYTALDAAARPGDAGGAEQIRFSEMLGSRAGRLLHSLLLKSGVRRTVIAGGDTSSHAGRQLGVRALTFQAAIATGAPLCKAHSDSSLDGLEIVFKGGQIGGDTFFEFARTGRA